ncbi:HutD family protein [Aliikangiella maris]|uniref:HutD family protein n=2 Tax=Aliikangiella maris TaxID=3162458 RepID=A0ABV2BVH1_9GAMM
MATVTQDGPFSLFEHYQRCIMLLEGTGMRLRFNQQEWITVNTPLQRQLFSGQWQTDCKLVNGTIRDFNLMVDQRVADFKVDVFTLNNQNLSWPEFFTSEDHLQYIDLAYVISGECELEYKTPTGESKMKKLSAEHTLVNKIFQLKSVQSFDSNTKIFIARILIK